MIFLSGLKYIIYNHAFYSKMFRQRQANAIYRRLCVLLILETVKIYENRNKANYNTSQNAIVGN